MEPLASLLGRTSIGQESQAIRASAIIAAVNEAIYEIVGLGPDDARAISVKHGVVTVNTSHGGVAGTIVHRRSEILRSTGTRLARRYPGQRAVVTGLITRAR